MGFSIEKKFHCSTSTKGYIHFVDPGGGDTRGVAGMLAILWHAHCMGVALIVDIIVSVRTLVLPLA